MPFGFHLWGLILFEIITIFFEKLLCFQKKLVLNRSKPIETAGMPPSYRYAGLENEKERILHERMHYSITM